MNNNYEINWRGIIGLSIFLIISGITIFYHISKFLIQQVIKMMLYVVCLAVGFLVGMNRQAIVDFVKSKLGM